MKFPWHDGLARKRFNGLARKRFKGLARKRCKSALGLRLIRHMARKNTEMAGSWWLSPWNSFNSSK